MTARKISDAHKDALAEGRRNSATVDRYLTAVNTPGRRGRPVTRQTTEVRLAVARADFKMTSGVAKVQAAQTIRDCQARLTALAAATNGNSLASLEAAFVKVALTYSAAHGIGYAAWRDAGVPATVLAKAKIARTRTVR